MKRIAYGETIIATDARLADLVLRYATLLARRGDADTVGFPGSVGGGPVEPVSMLIGPASQLTTWEDDEPFAADVTEATAELERRIARIEASVPPDPTAGSTFDEFGDLEGPPSS